MRFLGRAIFTTILLGMVWWHGNALWQRLSQYGSQMTGAHVDQLKAARARLTYTLDHATWTLFTIPTGATSLRVSTNANLSAELVATPDATWHYAVAYEFLDAQGRVQTQHVYHHRSHVTSHTNPDTNEVSPTAFYLGAQLQPTDTRNLVVDLTGFPSASRARFRLAWQHESIEDVAMSLYVRVPVSERQVDYLWRRLPHEQKQSFAKGLVYATDFLTPSEKHQLLQNRWQALGPQGIEGHDYHSRTLYALTNIEPESTSEPTLPSGFIVNARHHGVMPIPAGGMALRLDFLPLSASHPPPNDIHVTWYGEQPHEQSHHRVTWQGAGTRFEREFPPGLLEIAVLEGATAVHAFRRDATQYTSWIIEPRYSRMYRLDPDQPIAFTVVHANQMPTPFRIDVRHLPHVPYPANSPPPAVAYELLTAQGKVVRAGHLTSASGISRYDHIPSLSPDDHVSDPSTSFFAVPAHVARLRIHLPSPPPAVPMLIAAWNRPADLIREFYIGDDRDTEVDDQRQWAWFPKRPDNAKQLVAEQRSYLLDVQPRPPQRETELSTEDDEVELYRPEGMWRGRYLFLPRTPAIPLRPQSLAVTFHPLSTGREQQLVLGGLPQLRFLQPTLMYFSKTVKPQTFEVRIDGVQQHHGTLMGGQGEIALPVIPAGAHRIQVNSRPETRWYISHAASGTPTHIKRLAYHLDASGLSFIYERQHVVEETLSMRWHGPYSTRQHAHIHVHLALSPTARHTPSSSWTFNERRYIFAPTTGPPIPVLNTAATQVESGQPFFLPIGHDVPVGRYRIRLRLEQGPPGYITLAKRNRGVFEIRKFTGEKVPSYAHAQP
jgi:hypothetical protein